MQYCNLRMRKCKQIIILVAFYICEVQCNYAFVTTYYCLIVAYSVIVQYYMLLHVDVLNMFNPFLSS